MLLKVGIIVVVTNQGYDQIDSILFRINLNLSISSLVINLVS